MKIDVLIKKIIGKKKQSHSLFAVIQPDAIYFSSADTLTVPECYPLADRDWSHALIKALKAAGVQGVVIDLVLHSQLYQSYQIDKPNIAREEWPAALPFLIKDLINEKPAEVVADAYPLSGTNKVQAYVISKKVILEMVELLKTQGCQLGRVLPEQEVWASSGDTLTQFLLLQRNKAGNFKFDAFVDQRCYFQRTLRGVVAPITGVASSGLQFDSLALELQRSIDYLSSQLKGIALHQLKVCCDGEDHDELVAALNERLNVKVSTLSKAVPQPLSGTMLAHYAQLAPHEALNFYQSHLKPKKDYFSLMTVSSVLLGFMVCMLAIAAVYHYQGIKIEQQVILAEQQSAALSLQLKQLKEQKSRHLPSPYKLAAAARIKKDIAAQQASLNAINRFEHLQSEGYSGVMEALANLARKDISLTQIEIDQQRFDIQGLARDAKAIPHWIEQFQQELHLVGRSFERLIIGRDENDIVTFELKTKQEM
ncbi:MULTISPECIES: MSHA biogenesis protein MshI [unclassified Vibrio]|uniref:MSHA biogenesis protein MshI n=1 Tax=unclassified Vibrio TaxID=2614977 RepID=UPI001483A579|nr:MULTISPECIES: MSHA biogenesis protein MshI [unclassified Vibrio]NNN44627.1 MSHA biogenesis protein MshI [Vibrio sp. 1-1(7)]NNN73143.1 MSHA biogenesis protein MshI [Vibrio sp. 12-2(3-a)]